MGGAGGRNEWMPTKTQMQANLCPSKSYPFLEVCLKFYFLHVYVPSLGPNLIWFPASLISPGVLSNPLSWSDFILPNANNLSGSSPLLIDILLEPWRCIYLHPHPCLLTQPLTLLSAMIHYVGLLLNWIAYFPTFWLDLQFLLLRHVIASAFYKILFYKEERERPAGQCGSFVGAFSSLHPSHAHTSNQNYSQESQPNSLENWHSQAFTLQKK